MAVKPISSKDNPQFKQLRSLANDNTSYRHSRQVWLEGEHLCQAALDSGLRFVLLAVLDTVTQDTLAVWETRSDTVLQLPVGLMSALSTLPSPPWIGGVVELPQTQALDSRESVVVLDQVQDPGNAGAILRCAAAFAFKQITTTPGSVALWSAKVVRAGMGAHFDLQLNESCPMTEILQLEMPVLLTDVHQGPYLHQMTVDKSLPWPCVWVFGHEGRGVSPDWPQAMVQRVRIAQPGGQESLNVAAAAAICLHASATSRADES